ncbi:putative Fe-containing alcohol dehydrogenase [Phyllosticta citriasiana]|uniref:Fe-containing alcohol dehydrogenase n=1 Tax=Phyllosticta citriasiana TaxID=595635 RepID=A0ABR1KF50_9PEZI
MTRRNGKAQWFTRKKHLTAQEIITLPFEGQSHPVAGHGLSFEQACAKHVDQDFRASRVYILASGTLARTTNVTRKLQEALGDKVVGVQDGMTPHTLWSEYIEVTKVTKEANADLLITLGGESLIDAAKIVSLLSGGEYSDHAGGTNDETHHKYGFGHAGAPLGPRPAILDPKLVNTMPQRFWLSSGVRAIDHCVETICSPFCAPKLTQPIQRHACMGAPLCARHGIGHQLGPLGVEHGETSCILLPAVCAFNLSHAAEGHIVLDVLWGLDVTARLFDQHGLRQGETPLANCLDVIFRGLGMLRRLADFGSKERVREILGLCPPKLV